MTTKFFEWYMSPLERTKLADWLARFNGHVILEQSALKTLSALGVQWDRTRMRLLYGASKRSAYVPVQPKSFFAALLTTEGGKGNLAEGNWEGVWALDVAIAILSLAGIEHEPTAGVPSKAQRYDVIVNLLRPEGLVQDADGTVGEIRG